MKEMVFMVDGMHCSSCEMLIQDSLEEAGVSAKASHKECKVTVSFDDTKISPEEVRNIIEKEGYRVR